MAKKKLLPVHIAEPIGCLSGIGLFVLIFLNLEIWVIFSDFLGLKLGFGSMILVSFIFGLFIQWILGGFRPISKKHTDRI